MKEIIGALSKALNVAESELSSALLDGEKVKDGAGAFITTKFSDHITKLNDEAETKRKRDVEQTQGRITKEIAEKFEKAIVDAVPGIDKGLKGEDLLKAVPEAIKKITNIQTEPDKIKASETYMQGIRETEERIKKEYEDKIKAKEDELVGIKSTVEKEKVSFAVLEAARKFENDLKLRTDIPAETIQLLKQTAQAELLNKNKFKVLENGEILAIGDDGQARKDPHGHTLKLENLIAEAYKPLEGLKAAADSKGDGGQGGSGKPPVTATLQGLGLTSPTTVDGYNLVLDQVAKLKNEGKIDGAGMEAVLKEAEKAVMTAMDAQK